VAGAGRSSPLHVLTTTRFLLRGRRRHDHRHPGRLSNLIIGKKRLLILVVIGVGYVAGDVDHVVRRLDPAMDLAIANFPPTVVATGYAEAALRKEAIWTYTVTTEWLS
jgi:hypothetical protein